ncbi:hypothetical protein O3M35_004864 [Rhynocoris fuscipes]|uniref:Uncharacterized protein n=1 Tax=Rhynocoris fuscipes TaxID=488301 RepID=A0AAW1DNR9_9HEMI
MGDKKNNALEEILISLRNMENKFDDLKESVDNSCGKFSSELKDVIVNFNEKFQHLENRVLLLETKPTKSEEDLDRQKEWRKRNLLIYNVSEAVNENISELENSILLILNEKLSLDISFKEIDWVKRIGKKTDGGKSRPVLIRLLSLRTKREILSNANKLRGCEISISEDFSQEVRATRRELIQFKKAALNANKKAYLRYDKLFVDGILYSLDELKIISQGPSQETLAEASNMSTQSTCNASKHDETENELPLLSQPQSQRTKRDQKNKNLLLDWVVKRDRVATRKQSSVAVISCKKATKRKKLKSIKEKSRGRPSSGIAIFYRVSMKDISVIDKTNMWITFKIILHGKLFIFVVTYWPPSADDDTCLDLFNDHINYLEELYGNKVSIPFQKPKTIRHLDSMALAMNY